MAVIKARMLPKGHVGALSVISRNHRSTRIRQELDISVSTPSAVLADVVEYLDRALLSEDADSQVGGEVSDTVSLSDFRLHPR